MCADSAISSLITRSFQPQTTPGRRYRRGSASATPAAYAKTEPCRQHGVDDRASDDVVDVIQPEANHRHSNGDRQWAIAEPITISDMGSDSACGATVCWRRARPPTPSRKQPLDLKMLDAVATTEPHDERRRPHRLSHRFVLMATTPVESTQRPVAPAPRSLCRSSQFGRLRGPFHDRGPGARPAGQVPPLCVGPARSVMQLTLRDIPSLSIGPLSSLSCQDDPLRRRLIRLKQQI